MINKNQLNKLYFLSILLLNLPTFKLNVSTWTIIRFIWIFIAAIILIESFLIKKKWLIHLHNQTIFNFSLLYLISQSLSILTTINIQSFLNRYETLLFSFLFLLISIALLRRKSITYIVSMFVLYSIPSLLLQLIIYFSPNVFNTFISPFLAPDDYMIIQFNLMRNRVYLENLTFIVVPFLVYFYSIEKIKINKFLYALFICLIIFISFVSNFRTQFLLAVLSYFATIFFFKISVNKFFLLFSLLIISMFISLKINDINLSSDANVLDRILIQNDENYEPIATRFTLWQDAWEMGLSSPIVGVGLGNFYEYKQSKTSSNFSSSSKAIKGMMTHPHNIFFGTFAETGFLGLFSLVALIILSCIRDYSILTKTNNINKSLVISFWSLLGYSFFNPATSIKFFAFIFLLRILIEQHYKDKSSFL